MEDVGGGFYRRSAAGGEERWFATELSHAQVARMFADCPVTLRDGAMSVTAHPDEQLGITVVQIAANHPASQSDLDTVSMWAVATAMVLELISPNRVDVV